MNGKLIAHIVVAILAALLPIAEKTGSWSSMTTPAVIIAAAIAALNAAKAFADTSMTPSRRKDDESKGDQS